MPTTYSAEKLMVSASLKRELLEAVRLAFEAFHRDAAFPVSGGRTCTWQQLFAFWPTRGISMSASAVLASSPSAVVARASEWADMALQAMGLPPSAGLVSYCEAAGSTQDLSCTTKGHAVASSSSSLSTSSSDSGGTEEIDLEYDEDDALQCLLCAASKSRGRSRPGVLHLLLTEKGETFCNKTLKDFVKVEGTSEAADRSEEWCTKCWKALPDAAQVKLKPRYFNNASGGDEAG